MGNKLSYIPRIPKRSKYKKSVPLAQRDAVDPVRVRSQLPDAKAEAALVETVNEFFDTTRRSGAGGTRTGVPGLQLLGDKHTREMRDAFTEVGKVSQKKLIMPGLNEFIGKPAESKKVKLARLKEAWCPDCGKRDIPPHLRTFNVSPILEPWPSVGLQPGDLVRHTVCKSCYQTAKKAGNNRMWVVVGNNRLPYSIVENLKRAERVNKNIEVWLTEAWNNRQEETFIDESGNDLAADE